jgi:hypothetical protein
MVLIIPQRYISLSFAYLDILKIPSLGEKHGGIGHRTFFTILVVVNLTVRDNDNGLSGRVRVE